MTREEAIGFWAGLRKTFSSRLEKEESHFGRVHLQTSIDAIDTAISALRAQREQEGNDWICTLKCTALMEEGMCSHGGLCCLHESRRIIQEKEPLTLDELRKMDGEPVWVVWPDLRIHSQWFIVGSVFWIEMFVEDDGTLLSGYGNRWLAYRQKPEEGPR